MFNTLVRGSGHSQVVEAGLAHRGGDGLHGGQDGVDELRQLAGGTFRLATRLDDEPGQGPHVGVEG